MNTTRRGFLASVAALLGYGAAGKSERAVPAAVAELPNIGDPYPRSEVTFLGGPLDGQRRQVQVAAEQYCVPVRTAAQCVFGVPEPRPHPEYLAAYYDRSENNPKQFVYRDQK